MDEPVSPGGLSVNPSTNLVYVARSGLRNTVHVIDGKTNSVIANIPIGGVTANLLTVSTGRLAVNPSTDMIYAAYSVYVSPSVLNYTVSVIDGKINSLTANIPIGKGLEGPVAVAVNPSTNTVYVANYIGGHQGYISVLNGK